jgi:tryptophanyl-tRNA synthetase
LNEARDKYFDFIAKPEMIEEILQVGATKARALAQPFVSRLREAVGLRTLAQSSAKASEAQGKKRERKPYEFKVYRDTDGRFAFKILSGKDDLVFVSAPFATPQQAGVVMAKVEAALSSEILAMPRPQREARLLEIQRLAMS